MSKNDFSGFKKKKKFLILSIDGGTDLDPGISDFSKGGKNFLKAWRSFFASSLKTGVLSRDELRDEC